MRVRIDKLGFTLVELLVVLSIIGVIASVVFASLMSARQRAAVEVALLNIAESVLDIFITSESTNLDPDVDGLGIHINSVDKDGYILFEDKVEGGSGVSDKVFTSGGTSVDEILRNRRNPGGAIINDFCVERGLGVSYERRCSSEISGGENRLDIVYSGPHQAGSVRFNGEPFDRAIITVTGGETEKHITIEKNGNVFHDVTGSGASNGTGGSGGNGGNQGGSGDDQGGGQENESPTAIAEVVDPEVDDTNTLIVPDADSVVDVTLSGALSTDSDGVIVSYVWREGIAQINLGTTQDPEVVVTVGVGTHTYLLEVTDDDGASRSRSISIIVTPEEDLPPELTEVTPVPNPTTNPNPSYTFTSTSAGDINLTGNCTSNTATAVEGNNTITFEYIGLGTFNCSLTVTDVEDRVSNSLVISYEIISTDLTQCTTLSAPGLYTLTNDIANYSAGTCFKVTADDVTINCANHTIDGADQWNGIDGQRTVGVHLIGTSNANLLNCTITDFYHGTYVSGGTNNRLNDVTLTSNIGSGLWSENSSSITIDSLSVSQQGTGVRIINNDNSLFSNITISGSTNRGLDISSTDNSVLTEINVSGSGTSDDNVYISQSSNNNINNIQSSGAGSNGFALHSSHSNQIDIIQSSNNGSGMYMSSSNDNVISNGTFNNNANGSGVNLQNSARTQLTTITANSNGNGIVVNNSPDIVLDTVTSSWNNGNFGGKGIEIRQSIDSRVSNATLIGNKNIGIDVSSLSDRLRIESTVVENQPTSLSGVSLSGSSDIVIDDVEVSGGGASTIGISEGSTNASLSNTFVHDTGTGIGVNFSSSGMQLTDSTIQDYRTVGLSFSGSGSADNLTIFNTNPNPNSDGVRFLSFAQNARVSNSDIYNNRYGIAFNGSSGHTIFNTDIHDNTDTGVLMGENSTNNTIYASLFTGNAKDIKFYGNITTNDVFANSLQGFKIGLAGPAGDSSITADVDGVGMIGNYWGNACSSTSARGAFTICTNPSTYSGTANGPTNPSTGQPYFSAIISDSAPLANWSVVDLGL